MPKWLWVELHESEKYLGEEETPQHMSTLACETTVQSHEPQLCASWKLLVILGKADWFRFCREKKFVPE